MDPLEGLKQAMQDPLVAPALSPSHLARSKTKPTTLTDLVALAHDNTEKLQGIADDLVQRLAPVSKIAGSALDAINAATPSPNQPALLDSVESLNRKLERLTGLLADVKSRLLI